MPENIFQSDMTNIDSDEFRWFAIEVKQRYERFVAGILEEKQIAALSPFYVVRKQVSDKVRALEIPFFPGYVFGRFDPAKRMPVLTTPGVRRIVSIGKEPVALSDEEVHSVQLLLRSKSNVQQHPYLRLGSPVLIVRGPLAGLRGYLVEMKSSYRVIVSVTLIQRSIAAEVDISMLSADPSVAHVPPPASEVLAYANYPG
jgi:transcription termination/antitermination protein NusG